MALVSLLLVGSMVPALATMQSEVTVTAQEAASVAGMAVGRMIALMVIGSIVGLLAHGMTVLMAQDALTDVPVSLSTAWTRTRSRIVPLVITAVLVGIMVSLGTVLLVIPGVVLGFFLMFSFVSLMVEEASPFEAVKTSMRTVKNNFGATFIFFPVVTALSVLAGIVTVVTGLIPVLGAIISVLLGSAFASFVTVFVVAVYGELASRGGEAVDPEV